MCAWGCSKKVGRQFYFESAEEMPKPKREVKPKMTLAQARDLVNDETCYFCDNWDDGKCGNSICFESIVSQTLDEHNK